MGCDVCHRAPVGWQPMGDQLRRVMAFDWIAELEDGTFMDKKSTGSIDRLPIDRVVRLTAFTDVPGVPIATIDVDRSRGEVLHMFTRQAIRMNVSATVSEGMKLNGSTRFSVLVLQVSSKDDPKRFVRLYLHPTDGPILSNRDLEF